jgi:hypothetical protein
MKQALFPLYVQLTPFLTLVSKSLCHDSRWWLRGSLVCTICASHASCIHRSQNKILDISMIFYIFLVVYLILKYNAKFHSKLLYFYRSTELFVCSVSCTMSAAATLNAKIHAVILLF